LADLALTVAYIVSALISGTIALYAWHQRRLLGNLELFGLMLAATIWSATSAPEWLAARLNDKLFWAILGYVGSQIIPVFYLLFVLRYTQQAPWLTRKRAALLFILPVVAVGMAATNNWHHLLWSDILLHTDGSRVTATYQHGPFFWVLVIYAYSLLSWGVAALLRSIIRSPHLYSVQSRYLLLASLAPLGCHIFYIINPSIFGGADPTPVAFTMAGFFLGWAIFHHQLLNLHPIARERLMEDLTDGIILIDTQGRVVDANPMARRMLGTDHALHPDLIGQPIGQVIPEWPRLVEKCGEEITGQIEWVVGGSVPQYWELSCSSLKNSDGGQLGSLVILHDITQRRQAEQALQAHEHYLTMVNEITSEALKASDTQGLLQILADRMGALIGADGCYITLWDEKREMTVPMAASGLMRGQYPSDPVSGPEELTMTKSVLQAGHALVAEDVFNTPYMSATIATTYPSRSMLGIPLIAGDRKLGAVLVCYNTPHAFSLEEISLEEQAAAQAALAFAKVRLLEDLHQTHHDIQRELTERQTIDQALQRRAQELAALYDTSIDINSQLDLSLLLQAIVERAIALSGADLGGLYLLRPKTRSLELVASCNMPEEYMGTALQIGEGVAGQVAITGEMLMVQDYSTWSNQAPVYTKIGFRRVLGVPLKTKGQVLGVISIADTQKSGVYTEEQVRLVSMFADQASIAVENARLFEELQEANAQLEMLATTDKVTGAYNRRKYDEVLIYEILKAQRYNLPLALIMFDIDHFKQVNDTYGHQAGDQALIELVKLVRENIRGSDWLARWGGEEFMILAPGINLPQATLLAEKIRNLIDTHPFASVEHMTVSMGVCDYRPGDTPEMITMRVDTAMYQAKDAGRNCFAAL
jgi:diguanylate cyclase (GGDEF)-like protein/PAS domain S-box-containing protein